RHALQICVLSLIFAFGLLFVLETTAFAADAPTTPATATPATAPAAAVAAPTAQESAGASSGDKDKAQAQPAPKYPPFADVTKDAKEVTGLINVYHKGTKLLAEIAPNLLDRDFIVLISIAKGIGQQPLLGGMTWGFGDDWIWQFHKVDDRILIVR